MDLINGKDTGPLAGYAIVPMQGITLLGLLTGQTLSPVYELKCIMQPGREGVQIAHACFPVLLLASIEEIDVPDGSLVIRVETLSRTERQSLAAGVENGAQMVRVMRASAAGVTLATRMPALGGK
jgi:hypothetical protein